VDHEYMACALRLAARGLYTAHPNPRVGCVLLRDGKVVGEGWHERAGEAHAEIRALQQASGHARGATAYVTLEPCCHTGRTPPCTDALIKAGVARVVCAMSDPNPQVAGNGLKQLAAAGIKTESGVLQAEAAALNSGFIMRMKKQRPYVRCKLAMSLDGRTALASGESRWITGNQARADVQQLRARSGAILTGIGTVLADDPRLTVREETDELALTRQPLRVVLDTHLRMPIDARLLKEPGRTMIFTAERDEARKKTWQDAEVEIVTLPAQGEHLDLASVLQSLAAQQEINEVLLEAGATLSGAMLQAGLIDELIIYMAPRVLGDAARGLLHLPGITTLNQSVALSIREIRAVGQDWRITAHPETVS
jgi:diaminohydroxyphosphoribosylaminopyrimidine deaminase/5-amino-6-(5-phosphoribosylamino)uracil reductase